MSAKIDESQTHPLNRDSTLRSLTRRPPLRQHLIAASAFFLRLTLIVANFTAPSDDRAMKGAPIYPGIDGQTGAIGSAANWLAGVLTGTAGTVIATLAVAGIGLAMLHGRVSVRSGLRVAIGCFILFGAPAIAQELLGLARWNGGPAVIEVQPAPVPPPIAVPSLPPQNADPYAGASVPM